MSDEEKERGEFFGSNEIKSIITFEISNRITKAKPKEQRQNDL